MKKAIFLFFIIIGIFANLSLAVGEGEPASEIIKDVVSKNLQSAKEEDIEMMLTTIHTQSPGYLMTKQQMEVAFENYDLDYKLTYFKYIGQDSEYAIARTRQTTKKIAGGYFQNNEVDMIQVFKQEDGEWKFWNQVILDVKYI